VRTSIMADLLQTQHACRRLIFLSLSQQWKNRARYEACLR